jgi:hypothetical protein
VTSRNALWCSGAEVAGHGGEIIGPLRGMRRGLAQDLGKVVISLV